MTMRRIRLAPILLAFVTLTAGCGLNMDTQAELIDAGSVEYGLLETTTSTTSSTIAIEPTQVVNFYWHNGADNRLVVVPKGRDVEQQPGDALLELVAGPLESDLEDFPNTVTLLDITTAPMLVGPDEAGVFQIRINRLAEEPLTTGEAAELVCTAVQFPAIERVQITDLEGNPFSLSGNGAVALTEPAKAENFGNCLPDPLPTDESTTTSTSGGSTPNSSTVGGSTTK